MVAEVLEFLKSPISGAEDAWASASALDAEVQDSGLKAAALAPVSLPAEAVVIDGTLGTGGHTLALLRSRPDLRVVAFDRDASSIEVARARLREAGLEARVAIVRGDFRHAPRLLESHFEKQASESGSGSHGPASTWGRVEQVDGALVDAGMSLWQVSDAAHGLSFRIEAPLDMRYDRSQSWSAWDIVNRALPGELEDVLFSYTDERWARRIVEFIMVARRKRAISSTLELAEIVQAAIPAGARRQSRVHAATKTFAALRLAVNTEYWALDEGVRALCSLLAFEARLVVLTYSSHEDRIVKRLFRRLSSRSAEASAGSDVEAIMRGERSGRKARAKVSARATRESLPSGLEPLEPEIVELLRLPGEEARDDQAERALLESGWGRNWIGHVVTKKPVEPSQAEIESNPLSRSCKLRTIEKRRLDAW